MFALVVLLAVLVPAGPLALDSTWFEAMHHLQTPLLTGLALAFNWLGRGLGRAIVIALVGSLLVHRRRWLALAAFVVAETMAPLLSIILKALIDRPRPPDGRIHAVGSSFPSGHATYAGVTCLALVLLFTTPGTRRRWWSALGGLGVVGMAWSRTYLQAHWLTDVIAGSLLGIGLSLLVFAIAQRTQNALERDGQPPPVDLVGAGDDQRRLAARDRAGPRSRSRSPSTTLRMSGASGSPSTFRPCRRR